MTLSTSSTVSVVAVFFPSGGGVSGTTCGCAVNAHDVDNKIVFISACMHVLAIFGRNRVFEFT